MDILALNPQTSPKNEQKKRRKAYLKMIASNKIDQNSAKHLSSSLPLSLENAMFSLTCSLSKAPTVSLARFLLQLSLSFFFYNQPAPLPKQRIPQNISRQPPKKHHLLLKVLQHQSAPTSSNKKK